MYINIYTLIYNIYNIYLYILVYIYIYACSQDASSDASAWVLRFEQTVFFCSCQGYEQIYSYSV